MKISVMVTTLCLLVGISPLAAGAPRQSQDPIESIRERYANINNKAATYRKVKKDLSGYSAEGGELVAYFHGPSIMKMVATFYGEMGRAMEEYYYWNGKLIFVLRQELRYDKPLSGKVVSKKENRFYFAGDRLVRWIDENGKQTEPTASAENQYLKSSKEFSEAARSKGK